MANQINLQGVLQLASDVTDRAPLSEDSSIQFTVSLSEDDRLLLRRLVVAVERLAAPTAYAGGIR